MSKPFTVAVGPHPPMLAVQAHDLTLEECRLVQSLVTNQWVDSEDYKLAHAASAFLQGYTPPWGGREKDNGWVLVEFWTDNRAAIDAFVAHLNARRLAHVNSFRPEGLCNMCSPDSPCPDCVNEHYGVQAHKKAAEWLSRLQGKGA